MAKKSGAPAVLKNGMGFRDDFIFGMIFLTFVLLAITEVGRFVMLLTPFKKRPSCN